MKWYYRRGGNYIHVRVFHNGLAGTLCFAVTEFEQLKDRYEAMQQWTSQFEGVVDSSPLITFINEDKAHEPN